MYWCEISLIKNEITDQIKITDLNGIMNTFNLRAGVQINFVC